MVCTGNTCRSPMAAALLARAAREAGCAVQVSSAGTGAWAGSPASPAAIRALRRYGEDISGHRARALTADEVLRADLILTMTRAHRAMVRLMVPEAGEKVHTMAGFARYGWQRGASAAEGEDVDVPDPVGCPEEEYERAAARLWELARSVVARLCAERPGDGTGV